LLPELETGSFKVLCKNKKSWIALGKEIMNLRLHHCSEKGMSQCCTEEKHDIKEKPKIKIPPKTPWYHPFPCKTTKERIVITDNKIEIKNDKIERAEEKEHHAQ
jgi:hypothetical protein